jgi:hypothetical protein
MLLLSRIIMKSSLFIIRIITLIFKTLWSFISYPFKLMFRLVSYPARFIARIAAGCSRRLRNTGRTRIARVKLWKRIFKNARKKI